MKNIDYRCKYWLYDQYVNKEKSLRTIANECGLKSRDTVHYWMKKFNIQRRQKGQRGENHPQWKGGDRNYCYRQARKIWEEYWREEVPSGYVIHHVDKDYGNNDVCNLALLTHSYHAKVHNRGRKKC